MKHYFKEVSNDEHVEPEILYRTFEVLKDFDFCDGRFYLKKGEVLEARLDNNFYLIKGWRVHKKAMVCLEFMRYIKWSNYPKVKDKGLTETDIGNWYISRNGNKLQLISLIQDKYFIVTDHKNDKYACDKNGFSVNFQGEKALKYHDLIFQVAEYEKIEFNCDIVFTDTEGHWDIYDSFTTTDLMEIFDRYQPEKRKELGWQVVDPTNDEIGFFLDTVITENQIKRKLFFGEICLGEIELRVKYRII